MWWRRVRAVLKVRRRRVFTAVGKALRVLVPVLMDGVAAVGVAVGVGWWVGVGQGLVVGGLGFAVLRWVWFGKEDDRL